MIAQQQTKGPVVAKLQSFLCSGTRMMWVVSFILPEKVPSSNSTRRWRGLNTMAKKLSCCPCQESNPLPYSSPHSCPYTDRATWPTNQQSSWQWIYVHKQPTSHNSNCYRPWGSSTSIFSSVYQPVVQTVTLPAAVHLKHTVSMFYPPQLSLSCNVMPVTLVPEVFLFQMLFNKCCMYTFLQWWLQLRDRCEVVFISIVYWMMLPETLTKQHEMERQLTNRRGYGRKWSRVNLRY